MGMIDNVLSIEQHTEKTNSHPQGQPGKRLPSFYTDRPREAPCPKSRIEENPKPTIMDFIGKQSGISVVLATVPAIWQDRRQRTSGS